MSSIVLPIEIAVRSKNWRQTVSDHTGQGDIVMVQVHLTERYLVLRERDSRGGFGLVT